MKICIAVEPYNLISGHCRLAVELAGQLVKMNHEVVLLTTRPTDAVENLNKQLAADVSLSGVEILAPFHSSSDPLTDKTKSVIRASLKGVDLVHGFNFRITNLIMSLYGAERDFFVVYHLSGQAKWRWRDLLKAGPSSFLILTRLIHIYKLLSPAGKFKKILMRYDKITVGCNFLAELVKCMGIDRERIEVVPWGLDMKRFTDVSSQPFPARQNFLYFGWGSSIRGVPDVLEAFKLLLRNDPSVRLTLCFPGFHGLEEEFLKFSIRKMKISESVSLKSFVPDILKMIADSSVVILPFRSTAGFPHPPLAILEAMAVGRVVISTLTGSIPEIICDNKTGFLVPPRYPSSLYKKMLLTYNTQLRREIGERSREYIALAHSWEYALPKILNVYKQIQKKG